jgi:flavin-dependent dehydrogenase
MVRCDALIVGGGPAGLAAAIALRQKGLDVLVADAMQPPIDKACGEGLMPDAQKDLAALGITLSREDGALFHGITFLAHDHQATAHFAHGHGVGLRRLQLHARLMERCEQLGVRMAWGTRVGIAGNTPFQLNGEACVYRYAVGADGQSSRVRQALGMGEGKILSRRFGARCHYHVQPWSRMVEVHWGPLGPAYVTPVGPQTIGVATVARSSVHRMDDVLEGLPVLRRKLHGAQVLSTTRGAVTTTRKLRRVTAGATSLIGDASGSVDAITGEGIALAFRQALLLGEAVAAGDLTIYERGHGAIVRMPHLMSRVLLSLDAHAGLRDWAIARLAAQPQLFARLLALHLGDTPGSHLVRELPMLGLRLLWPAAVAPTRIY